MTRRAALLYDGRCPFCRVQARRLARIARCGTVELVDLHGPGALDAWPHVTREACLEALHLVLPDGTVFRGMEAVVRVAMTRRVVGWPLRLYFLPPLRRLADAAYRWIARNRYRLPGAGARAGRCRTDPGRDEGDGDPRVVILGGGFGGLHAARALGNVPVRVTLVDRRNYHLFQPLLYQVAAAMLNPSDIAVPIRSVLRRQRNVEVLLAEAVSVDVESRRVRLRDGDLAYDYLIVATGTTHSYFGRPQWAEHAPGLKTIEDALEIRRRVFLAYERAERETDAARRREWLTFVIVGGGPTGVELAGALAEIARHGMRREFRRFDPTQAEVILLEGRDRLLPSYPPELSDAARCQLERLGVEVRTGRQVTSVDDRGVDVGEERIAARTVVWAAGVEASSLARSLGVPLDPVGRVLVERDLSIPGHPEVFVIGDLAHIEQDGRPIPGLAPAAIQEGRHVAENLRRLLRGEPPRPFRYVDRGSFATVGRGAAVGVMAGGLRISGPVAWLAWMLVHILFLIGFRNRFFTMLHWAYHYLTYRRGARLITDGVRPRTKPPP